MWEALINIIARLITDVTIPSSITVADTVTKVTPKTGENSTDMSCRIVEVRNTSTTLGIRVYCNKSSDYVTLVALERRIFMVKKLSDLEITLASGSTSTRVEIVIEP
jgi:hypothetical protein